MGLICVSGITDRFGDDVFERLKRDGSVDVPGDKPWVLTAEVSVVCSCYSLSARCIRM